MTKHSDRNRRDGSPFNSDDSEAGPTLLPMLIGGLVLIVVGSVIVTTFV
jgi:hypothetical protein